MRIEGIRWFARCRFYIPAGLAAADLPDPMALLARHLWRDSLLPLVVDASTLDWLPLGPASGTH